MFLSRLILNPLDRRGMTTVSDVYRLHQTVMYGFKEYGARPRVLYRMEPEMTQSQVVVLVQSSVEPRWAAGDSQWGGIESAQSKVFVPVIKGGMSLRFRLRANPTVCRDGKRYGLVRDEALEAWLRRWEERVGARFGSFHVADEGYLKGAKGKQRIHIKAARFDGRLVVHDAALFLQGMESGIGPAKGFGCGMLSIAPA